MSKKNSTDIMEKFYIAGNFFGARKRAKQILNAESSNDSLKKEAKSILSRTGIDRLVILSGVGVFLFISIVALWARYKG